MRTFIQTVLSCSHNCRSLSSCAVPFQPRMVRGSGDIVVEDRKVSGFDKILMRELEGSSSPREIRNPSVLKQTIT